jgi:hypothetical protein
MSNIHEAIKKNILILDEWELCCNVIISLKKISEGTFQRFSTFSKGNNDYYSHNLKQSKQCMLLILRQELISLKPIRSQNDRNG